MAVHLVQLLCPQRHAIVALAYEAAGDLEADKTAVRRLKLQWTGMVASGQFNPWCGICGSRELRYEGGKTRWESMDEAAPFLREEEAKNAAARAIIDEGRSREN